MDKFIRNSIIVLIILAALKYAGNMDREEHAILTMSQTEYDEIKDSLQTIHNSEPSDGQIANEWYNRKGK